MLKLLAPLVGAFLLYSPTTIADAPQAAPAYHWHPYVIFIENGDTQRHNYEDDFDTREECVAAVLAVTPTLQEIAERTKLTIVEVTCYYDGPQPAKLETQDEEFDREEYADILAHGVRDMFRKMTEQGGFGHMKAD